MGGIKKVKIHIVQKGDTLWKLAQKYGVNFEELKAANGHLSNPDLIMPGMKIKIPSGSVKAKKEAMIAKEAPIKEAPKEKPKMPPPSLKEEKEVPIKMPAPPKVQQHLYQIQNNFDFEFHKEMPKEMPKVPAPPKAPKAPAPPKPKMEKPKPMPVEKPKKMPEMKPKMPEMKPKMPEMKPMPVKKAPVVKPMPKQKMEDCYPVTPMYNYGGMPCPPCTGYGAYPQPYPHHHAGYGYHGYGHMPYGHQAPGQHHAMGQHHAAGVTPEHVHGQNMEDNQMNQHTHQYGDVTAYQPMQTPNFNNYTQQPYYGHSYPSYPQPPYGYGIPGSGAYPHREEGETEDSENN